MYTALKDNNANNYLELDLSFFLNGVLMEVLKYFRNESSYSLDDLLANMKKWFEKLFN